jgi:hypothetical protein
MEKATEKVTKIADKVGGKVEQSGSKWIDIVKELVDKLTGKNMEFSYEFKNLEIEIPKATGPNGQDLGSAKWKVNGKFTMSTEMGENSEDK